MNKLIAVVITSVMIVGCQNSEEKKDEIMIEKCVTQLKTRLKDPDSIKYGLKHVFHSDGIQTVSISYNAKNGFGGYVGSKSFHCSFDPDGNITNSF